MGMGGGALSLALNHAYFPLPIVTVKLCYFLPILYTFSQKAFMFGVCCEEGTHVRVLNFPLIKEFKDDA